MGIDNVGQVCIMVSHIFSFFKCQISDFKVHSGSRGLVFIISNNFLATDYIQGHQVATGNSDAVQTSDHFHLNYI